MHLAATFSTMLLIATAASAEVWVGGADVEFKGYSTLHNFTGTMPTVPLRVTVQGEKKDGRTVAATSEVAVAAMSTRHEERDQNMRTMFSATKYPLIKIVVPPTSEAKLRPGGNAPGAMPVQLSIAGVTNTISAAVSQVVETSETVSFDLVFTVSLKAFHLDPPKALAGLVRVRDTVDVRARVKLRRQNS